ncbi:MAG: hypothetical protein IPP51_05380 [Bacteroidetes bacterium]|nr:hypothetical protein [Bacteroidota bacterium]
MKKLLFIAALMLMIPLLSIGQTYFGPGAITTSIAGSVHDFSIVQWNPYNATTTLGGQICQPCHTPQRRPDGYFRSFVESRIHNSNVPNVYRL